MLLVFWIYLTAFIFFLINPFLPPLRGFVGRKRINFSEKMNIYRLRTMIWKMVFALRADILNAARRQRFVNALVPFKIQI